MSLEIEERKLTHNIDSYPCWDNEIHKKLKMKYYSDNCDERLVNLELNKELNQDFNDRYFPPKYPTGSTLQTLVDEKKLYEKLAEPAKVANVFNSNVQPEKFKSSSEEKMPLEYSAPIERKPISLENKMRSARDVAREVTSSSINTALNSMANLNKQRTEEAKKKFNVKIDRLNIEEEEKQSPPSIASHSTEEFSPTGSETTRQHSSLYPGTTVIGEHPPIFEVGEEESSKPEKKQSKITKDQAINKLNNYWKMNNEQSLKIPNYEISFRKSTKDNTKEVPVLKAYNMPGKLIQKKEMAVNTLREFINEYEKEHNILEAHQEFASAGLKQKKKTNAWLKNRFEILKGEILASNDNPLIIKEIKQVSKELYNRGLLNKCL